MSVSNPEHGSIVISSEITTLTDTSQRAEEHLTVFGHECFRLAVSIDQTLKTPQFHWNDSRTIEDIFLEHNKPITSLG